MEKNPLEQTHSERVPDASLISEIQVIQNGGINPRNIEDLALLVEPPLLEACEELYRKNIKTVMSSANSKDVLTGEAYIDIEFDTLSEENKTIATALGKSFMMHGFVPTKCIKLKFPIGDTTTVGDVRRMADEVVSKFKMQEKVVQEVIDPFKISQEKMNDQIAEIPALKQMLKEWRSELAELEKSPDANPKRFAELQRDVPDLGWEIDRREELISKEL